MMKKRDLIIESAIELFSSKGFQATSTTSITKNAGVGTGTLFLYFKSKDELINQIYLEIKAELARKILKGLDTSLPLKARLKLIWNLTTKWAIQHPRKFQFIMHFSNSPFINNITKEEAIGDFSFVFDLIHEGISNQIFAPIEDEFVYALINSHLNGSIQYLLSDSKDVETIIEQSFQILWKGLGS